MSSIAAGAHRGNCSLSRRLFAGAAASTVTGTILITVGLLFSAPPAAAETPAQAASATQAPSSSDPSIARGRYLVQIGGCNDCHTPGYAETAGELPTDEWLTGQDIGFRGPWGTSYPSNLRLTINWLTEEEWLTFARAPRLPPMPWFNLRDMSDQDLRAVYRFIRDLGPKGERMPAPAPPGQSVATPFFEFEPRVEQSALSTAAATAP